MCMSDAFRAAEPDEVESIFLLYKKRIHWMDKKGICQWNTTGYLEAYPVDYYVKQQTTGNLYVLTEGNIIVGKGMAVIPSEGVVKAPCDAEVSMVFDTKHAIGLTTESGIELLIHVGLNTVELEGKYYTVHVNDGDKVKKGQTLITFEMDKIKDAGYDVTTPMIVTNTDDFEEVTFLNAGTVNTDSRVLEVR